MLYAVRVICETIEQVGDTLFHPLRWWCTAEPAQHLLSFRLFRKLWLVGAFFVCCDELILIYELGISFFSGIARVRQNTGDHIFIPEPSLVIWNILLAKCLGQLIQGFSCNISEEDFLHKLRLCFLYDDLTLGHLVAEGLLPVSHHRTVLSMDSRSSSPFFRQKRTESLLSRINS